MGSGDPDLSGAVLQRVGIGPQRVGIGPQGVGIGPQGLGGLGSLTSGVVTGGCEGEHAVITLWDSSRVMLM